MYESLYQLIGEKDFYKSLKTYFEANKYSNATPEDLIFAFEKTTNQNLSNFFESWIKGKVIIR
jgi:aminopeptidase N